MIYEYGCFDCQVKWTESRRVDDRDLPAFCSLCTQQGIRQVTAPGLIFKDDNFPSNDFKEGAFWRPDGRARSFDEHEFLDREASDDASAAPDTCVNVAKANIAKAGAI